MVVIDFNLLKNCLFTFGCTMSEQKLYSMLLITIKYTLVILTDNRDFHKLRTPLVTSSGTHHTLSHEKPRFTFVCNSLTLLIMGALTN